MQTPISWHLCLPHLKSCANLFIFKKLENVTIFWSKSHVKCQAVAAAADPLKEHFKGKNLKKKSVCLQLLKKCKKSFYGLKKKATHVQDHSRGDGLGFVRAALLWLCGVLVIHPTRERTPNLRPTGEIKTLPDGLRPGSIRKGIQIKHVVTH